MELGFEQESAEEIFQVFQRAHRHPEYKGTDMVIALQKCGLKP